jgi:hypothetical protein
LFSIPLGLACVIIKPVDVTFFFPQKVTKEKLAAYALFYESLCLGLVPAARRLRRRQEKKVTDGLEPHLNPLRRRGLKKIISN